MAVAEAAHHSAPRRLKTATAISEVEEQASHDGLGAQTAPPPGARPGILAEPGPQRSDRSLRHSSGRAPSLALVSLAGGDATDDVTVTFLLSAALSEKKEKEEEERRKREEELREEERKKLERRRAKALKGWDEEALWQLNRRIQAGSTLSSAEYAAWYFWDCGVSSSSSASGLVKRRKRKKKRKKRLPRTRCLPRGFAGGDAPRVMSSSGLRCSALWPIWTRRTVLFVQPWQWHV